MRKKWWVLIVILVLGALSACNNDNDELSTDGGNVPLNVEFEPSETIEVGEPLELKAIVTYGDEKVEDADEVNFEYWEGPDQENTTTIDSTNNGDGTYTAEVTFDHDGVFSIYAHTTARDLHTMPKREVVVGEGAEYPDDNNGDD